MSSPPAGPQLNADMKNKSMFGSSKRYLMARRWSGRAPVSAACAAAAH